MKDEEKQGGGVILHPSAFILRLRRMLRGEVDVRTLLREASRRIQVARGRRREREQLTTLNHQPARLREGFARRPPPELLAHFQSRAAPQFFPGFASASTTAKLQASLFPKQTSRLLAQANKIADEHCWPLLGFGEKCFGSGEIDWNLDPRSGFDWPIIYHPDINLIRNDGSDARVVWELNRFGHFITLGRAYALTGDEKFSVEFFHQLASWRAQNPVGRGVNWNCAMEVALRALNLLAAFTTFLRAPQMNEVKLIELLAMFEQHGAHIKRNLEFSHVATSNHYLADVTGLLWLGVMLPELAAAEDWREFGLRELLSEMDKQILADGADYEASTGYHRLKLEMFVYSFVLCHLNGIDIAERYWKKLRAMVDYVSAYLRPDGRAPLIGDTDSGQLLPIGRRAGDDHAYLLALSAAVFQETQFKIAGLRAPEELLWILGEQGVRDYVSLAEAEPPKSKAFPDAGTYVLRDHDLYLLFNASGAGINGRGSHGHNDALAVEISACGTPFIVDPGTYLYTADLKARHLFRSTAYHSTVEIDGVEQNTTGQRTPFVIGDEAHPRVLRWESGSEVEVISAEHDGYRRLSPSLTHRRTVTFYKREGWWLIDDTIEGAGEHQLAIRFHLASGLEVSPHGAGAVLARDPKNGTRLLIFALDLNQLPQFEQQFTSRDYGAKEPSQTACWSIKSNLPRKLRWALMPVRSGEADRERLKLIEAFRGRTAAASQ
jgi:hypothetical protein